MMSWRTQGCLESFWELRTCCGAAKHDFERHIGWVWLVLLFVKFLLRVNFPSQSAALFRGFPSAENSSILLAGQRELYYLSFGTDEVGQLHTLAGARLLGTWFGRIATQNDSGWVTVDLMFDHDWSMIWIHTDTILENQNNHQLLKWSTFIRINHQ